MRFAVNARDFRSALRGCEKSVLKDDYRPVLQFAQIVAKGDTVTLTALDGFQMVQYTLSAIGELSPGEALIPPKLGLITLHDVKGNASVEINDSLMRVVTDLAITITLPKIEIEYIRHEEIWPNPKRDKVRICVNPKYLMQVMQSLDVNNSMVWLEVPIDPLKPIAVTAGNDTFTTRGLVLPIRARS